MRKDTIAKKAKADAGELIQINLKLQTAADLKKMRRLLKANPGISRTALVRMAWDAFEV